MPDVVAIPDKYKDLLGDKKAFASLATLMPDGTPQVTPVWFDYDGKSLMVNSARGRQKDLNIRRDPRVTLTIMDPENPYRYVEVRGRVTDITQEGATEHIDKMAKKYLDKDKYPFAQPGEVRVLYRVRAEKVQGMG
ncbi:MAG TPA: PPOX class F420-dependent oxidoreductase [Terracidiphilus sp.]|jgi:PPOX class probable F420-dependent enzyme|nr:PPOX class F420-dependent oxidoreductase [Terracidiphilus sp.]